MITSSRLASDETGAYKVPVKRRSTITPKLGEHLDIGLPCADVAANPPRDTPGMELLQGTIELLDGARLEHVAVSLVKRPRGAIADAGWGGVFKCVGQWPLDLSARYRLLLEDGRFGWISVVHVSPIPEGSLALFRGLSPLIPGVAEADIADARPKSPPKKDQKLESSTASHTTARHSGDGQGIGLFQVG